MAGEAAAVECVPAGERRAWEGLGQIPTRLRGGVVRSLRLRAWEPWEGLREGSGDGTSLMTSHGQQLEAMLCFQGSTAASNNGTVLFFKALFIRLNSEHFLSARHCTIISFNHQNHPLTLVLLSLCR